MVSASAPSIWSQQRPHFSVHNTAKTNYKAHSSGRMVSSGISVVVIASVHSENAHLKKAMMKIIIIISSSSSSSSSGSSNKLQEMTVFSRRQKLTSAMKLRPDK